MSEENKTWWPGGIIVVAGVTIVAFAVIILIGGWLLRLTIPVPTHTDEFTPPPPTEEPEPTFTPIPTSTPLPVDAPILQQPRGLSNLYIEYILDASGSMEGLLTDGIPKREAARDYLIDHMLTFEPETHVGFRAFGHRVDWQVDKEGSCGDIELVAPVEVGQMETIAGWLDAFDTLGMTPLYASVELALEDFDTSDPERLNTIVMISDGIETCGGDPCELVDLAKAKGINFSIHVVGLHVDTEARNQLSCIARKGGGVYYDVHTSDDLGDALDDIQDDVQEDEEIVTFEQATEIAKVAMAPTNTPQPTKTPRPTKTSTPRPTVKPTTAATKPPTAVPPTHPPACTLPTIVEFRAEPPPVGSTARFRLYFKVEGADRVEIFGWPQDPKEGYFDVWDAETNWWVLWAKVEGTPDDCYVEKALLIDPDTITPPGPGLGDVTVSKKKITIYVHDYSAIDGDKIDLEVNGNKVLSNYTLTSSYHGVDVTLNSGENTVKVTALNQGSSGPNTVEIKVSDVTSGNPIQVSRGLATGESETFKIHAP